MGTSDVGTTSREAPEGVTDLSTGSWIDALKRTVKAFKADQLPIWAAALTYFGVLSIFPALLVVVSVLGLIGDSVTNSLIENLEGVAPGPAQDIVIDAIKNLQGAGSANGIAFFIGIAGAIWAASGYVNGFMSAANAIYDVEEGRPVTKMLPVRVGLTLVLMILAGIIAFSVTLTGGLAKEVGDLVGVGDTAVDVWNLAKWPVLLLLVSLLLAVLYWGAPNVKVPFRLVSPGSLLAVLGWVLASIAFAFYVSNFGSYNKTYGALAGPIVFLLWLWISNICVLLGAELNAELERSRKLEAGEITHEEEPFVEPRDTEKMDGTTSGPGTTSRS
jgi:membrane protein